MRKEDRASVTTDTHLGPTLSAEAEEEVARLDLADDGRGSFVCLHGTE